MRWFIDLPGPFGVSLGGGSQKRPTIEGIDAVDYYELQQVDSLHRFAAKLRTQGQDKRAERVEKKAEKKFKKVKSHYIDLDAWERNYWQ